MPKYARKTEVSADRSRVEIERTLERYGATQFVYGWEQERAVVGFRMHDRQIRFHLPLPAGDDSEFVYQSRGRRTPEAARAAWEQATRQRWRALALMVKAKLEAVEAGIVEFEQEFLGHIVLPGGETAGQWLAPQLERVYATRRLPALLPGSGPGPLALPPAEDAA
jgi:hypothetical protein